MKTTFRLAEIMVLIFVEAVLSHAAISGTPSQHHTPELAPAAKILVERGFHAKLPAHISTLLGLTHAEECAVMQGVLRSAGRVQGIDVTEKDHNDIVIFIVDETTSHQTLYLTSPRGYLRKVLSVDQGVGHVNKPGKPDLEAFEKEKKMWKERLAAVNISR